jgi:hypothetical protein
VPQAATAVWASLCFWTGRFEEAARLIARDKPDTTLYPKTPRRSDVDGWWRMSLPDLLRFFATRRPVQTISHRVF